MSAPTSASVKVAAGAAICVLALACGAPTTDAPSGDNSTAPVSGPPETATGAATTKPTKSGNAVEGIENQCNILGGQYNKLTCVLPQRPLSSGKVNLTWPNPAFYWVFDGPASEVGVPPRLRKTENYDRCPPWRNWLMGSPRMYALDPRGTITATSKGGAPVVLTGIRLRIFDKKKLDPNAVMITCFYRGGPDMLHYEAVIDSRKGVTQLYTAVADNSGGFGGMPSYKPFQRMPPGLVRLDSKGFGAVGYELRSQLWYGYAGMLVVTLEVDGQREVKLIGSEKTPLRWVDQGCDMPVPCAMGKMPAYTKRIYGWDGSTWVKNHQPSTR